MGTSAPGSFARPIEAGSSRAFGSTIWASAPSSVQFGELKALPETGAETHAEARRTRRKKPLRIFKKGSSPEFISSDVNEPEFQKYFRATLRLCLIAQVINAIQARLTQKPAPRFIEG